MSFSKLTLIRDELYRMPSHDGLSQLQRFLIDSGVPFESILPPTPNTTPPMASSSSSSSSSPLLQLGLTKKGNIYGSSDPFRFHDSSINLELRDASFTRYRTATNTRYLSLQNPPSRISSKGGTPTSQQKPSCHIMPGLDWKGTILPLSPPSPKQDESSSPSKYDRRHFTPVTFPLSTPAVTSPFIPPDDLFGRSDRPRAHHRRTSSSDSDRTIRPSPPRNTSTPDLSIISPPSSPDLQPESGLGLFTELSITSLHPRLAKLGSGRPSSPVPTVNRIGGKGVMTSSYSKNARETLQHIQKQHDICTSEEGEDDDDDNDERHLDRMVESARHIERGEH